MFRKILILALVAAVLSGVVVAGDYEVSITVTGVESAMSGTWGWSEVDLLDEEVHAATSKPEGAPGYYSASAHWYAGVLYVYFVGEAPSESEIYYGDWDGVSTAVLPEGLSNGDYPTTISFVVLGGGGGEPVPEYETELEALNAINEAVNVLAWLGFVIARCLSWILGAFLFRLLILAKNQRSLW